VIRLFLLVFLTQTIIVRAAESFEADPETFSAVASAFDKAEPASLTEIGEVGKLKARCVKAERLPTWANQIQSFFYLYEDAVIEGAVLQDPLIGNSTAFRMSIRETLALGFYTDYGAENLTVFPNGQAGKAVNKLPQVLYSSLFQVRKATKEGKAIWLGRLEQYWYYAQPSYIVTSHKVKSKRDTICYGVVSQ
jgi:hypothetical protein